MKVKFGAIVTEARGKINGMVASRNKAGAYFRTKVTPINRGSDAQSLIRSRLADLSQSWRGLTAAQRDAWNSAVSAFTRTDIFGDLKNPSGFNLYQRLNNNLAIVGQAAISTPPVPSGAGAFSSLSLAVVTGTPAVTLTFSPAIATDMSVKVYATAPLSAGVNFAKAEYRLIGVLTSSDTSPKAITSLYTAKFGSVGSTGQKIFVKCEQVNESTGETGVAVQASAISTVS